MTKKIILICLCICTSVSFCFGQDEETENGLPELKITGSPVITVFANYHAGIGSHNEVSGFELTRAYLGYQFNLLPTVSGKVFVDAGIPPSESASHEVMLKNAMLCWKDYGFTVNAGLISLLEFNLQEDFWNYRYIIASFQDLYKMGSSADLGITAQYQFAPWISADLSFTNGEGYRRINRDNNYRYGAGITVSPLSCFTFRIYGDFYNVDYVKDQRTISLFAGYKCKVFSLGTEYNYQSDVKGTSGNDYYGYSIYTNIPLAKKWNLFGRYDNINSKDIEQNAWYMDARHTAIGGFEFHPFKQLRIAPNYKYSYNALSGSPFHEIYLNAGFKW